MKLVRTIVAAVLSAAFPLQVIAEPHVIAQLGSSPLLGEITSTPQLQADVHRQRQIFETAGAQLGLTPKEYMEVEARIDANQLAYVTIPRHLDAMSWYSQGRVRVLHDVIVPAGTNGWEIDLQEGHQLLAVYIPAKCGNVSVIRKSVPVIAQARHRPRVLAESTAPPAQLDAAPPAVAEQPTTMPTPLPYASVAASTPSHRVSWWPLVLLPIIGIVASGGHGGIHTPTISTNGPPPASGGSPGSLIPPPGGGVPPPIAAPTPPPPPPVVCPTPH